MNREFQRLFVVGCGHSGTTLTATVLGAHSLIHTIPGETNLFVKPRPPEAIRGAFQQYEADAKVSAEFLCEKTPRHLRRIEQIRVVFPEARFVIPVRDPRSVAASVRRRTGNLNKGAVRWMLDNTLVAGLRSDPSVHVFRYEDMISDFDQTTGAICNFLGLRFEAVMRDFHQSAPTWFPQSGAAPTDGRGEDAHRALRNWQVKQPLLDRRESWREELTSDEAALVVSRTQPLMSEFGYRPD